MSGSTVVLFSGGLDSTTLLYQLRYEDRAVVALSAFYGQRHEREVRCAMDIAEEAGIDLEVIDLGSALHNIFAASKSSQVGRKVAVPHGHYAADSMRTTIVPGRNLMLISVAAALAQSLGYENVAFAAHAGDHAIYPDCRTDFFEAARDALREGYNLGLLAPFLDRTKSDIVRLGAQLHVPFAMTYSCYEGEATHCGACGTCVERREAFVDSGIEDPTSYKPQSDLPAAGA
jgi:7-cyano-7-deazaguanine synthase